MWCGSIAFPTGPPGASKRHTTESGVSTDSTTTVQTEINLTDRVNHLLAEGKKLEDSKDWEAALAVYREVLATIPVLSTQAQELQIIMSQIEMMLEHRKPETKPTDLQTKEDVARIDPDLNTKNYTNIAPAPKTKIKQLEQKSQPNKRPNKKHHPTTTKLPKSGTKIFFLTIGWNHLGLVGLGVIIFFIIGLPHPSA